MTRKGKKRQGARPRLSTSAAAPHDNDVDPPPKMTFSNAALDSAPEPVELPPTMAKPEPPPTTKTASLASPSKPEQDVLVRESPEEQTSSHAKGSLERPNMSKPEGSDSLREKSGESEAKAASCQPQTSLTEARTDPKVSPRQGLSVQSQSLDEPSENATKNLNDAPRDDVSEPKRDAKTPPPPQQKGLDDDDKQPSTTASTPPFDETSSSKGIDADDDKGMVRSPSIFRIQDAIPDENMEKACVARPPAALAPDLAQKVVQHILFSWIKGSVPVRQLFSPTPAASCHPLDAFLSTLRHTSVTLKPVEVSALLVAFPPTPAVTGTTEAALNVAILLDSMAAKLFPIELLEFQLRKAIVAKATKTRGKCDVFKTINQLFDSETVQDNCVTLPTWRSILVEKLALTCPQWVAQCVFCRVLAAPLAEMSPRPHFVLSLDRFVRNVQFDTLSVEGVFRSLVQDADFERGFRAIDADGSGSLSLVECTSYLQTTHNVAFPPAILQDFLRRFDRDGDGCLNLDEFMACCRPKHHTGVHVLSPYGFFYMTTDPMELVADVIARIHKRLFWLQHNHLLGTSHASSDHPPHEKEPKGVPSKQKLTVDPAKVSICRHFGALPLQYNKATDTVQSCFSNGELLVLFETDNDNQGKKPTHLTCKERHAIQRPPPLRPPPLQPPLASSSKPQLESGAFDQPEIEPKSQSTAPSPSNTPHDSGRVLPKLQPKRDPAKKTPSTPLAVLFPIDVSTWTRMDVKKWLIYTVQVKTLAPKFTAVDGKMLLEWANDPDLDMTLRDNYSITQPVHRLRLVKHIQELRPKVPKAAPATVDSVKHNTDGQHMDDDSGGDEEDEDLEAILVSTKESHSTKTSSDEGVVEETRSPVVVRPAPSTQRSVQSNASAHADETAEDTNVDADCIDGKDNDEPRDCIDGVDNDEQRDSLDGSGSDEASDAESGDAAAGDDDLGDECLPGFSDAPVDDHNDGRESPPPPFDDPPGFDD